jgi:cephalosporin hydroxylase
VIQKELKSVLNAKKSRREVLGLDIEIRQHNREVIESHSMSSSIQIIQDTSITSEVIDQLKVVVKNYKRKLVCLDSNHTHEHVLAELEAYAHLTIVGSYRDVMDTLIADLPKSMFLDRPCDLGNKPITVVCEYLKTNPEFEIDKRTYYKLLNSVGPGGFLKRIA